MKTIIILLFMFLIGCTHTPLESTKKNDTNPKKQKTQEYQSFECGGGASIHKIRH